jgi:hypothetical protein
MVVIPPLPRYLFLPCYNPTNRCSTPSPPPSEKILSELSVLRSCLIKSIVGISNVRVADHCVATTGTPTSNTSTRIEHLREVCGSDGVHFNSTCYSTLATNCTTCLEAMATKAASTKQSLAPKKRGHYLRGYRSDVRALKSNSI